MQVQRRGLSPAPFLVFVLLIVLGLSFMFIHSGITESKVACERVRDDFIDALEIRYSIVEKLADILILIEENKMLEQLKDTEDGVDGEIELEESQFHEIKYWARELAFEPMAYGKDDKRLGIEQTIEEFRNIVPFDEIDEASLALQFSNLMAQLDSTEKESFIDIREQYNEIAMVHNEVISGFPNNLVAFISRIKRAEMFPKLEGNN